MSDERSSTSKPAHEVKAGLVKAVIWPNATASGTRYNVTFARLYKQDDTWKSTASFGVRDLPDVGRAAVQAEAWIREHTPKREEAAA
jgi:hypothetical protein